MCSTTFNNDSVVIVSLTFKVIEFQNGQPYTLLIVETVRLGVAMLLIAFQLKTEPTTKYKNN